MNLLNNVVDMTWYELPESSELLYRIRTFDEHFQNVANGLATPQCFIINELIRKWENVPFVALLTPEQHALLRQYPTLEKEWSVLQDRLTRLIEQATYYLHKEQVPICKWDTTKDDQTNRYYMEELGYAGNLTHHFDVGFYFGGDAHQFCVAYKGDKLPHLMMWIDGIEWYDTVSVQAMPMVQDIYEFWLKWQRYCNAPLTKLEMRAIKYDIKRLWLYLKAVEGKQPTF